MLTPRWPGNRAKGRARDRNAPSQAPAGPVPSSPASYRTFSLSSSCGQRSGEHRALRSSLPNSSTQDFWGVLTYTVQKPEPLPGASWALG